jgi:hypothetical protein
VSKKPLVDDAEDVVADGREVPRPIGRVEAADKVGQDVPGDGERFRKVELEKIAIVLTGA